MKGFGIPIVANQQIIFEQHKVIQPQRLNPLKGPVLHIIPPPCIHCMIFVKSRVSIPQVASPSLRYSLTTYLKQKFIQTPRRLDTRVQIMQQMILPEEAVVEMQAETLVSHLQIEGFVLDQGEPDVGLAECGDGVVAVGSGHGLLEADLALCGQYIGVDLHSMVVHEILGHDVVCVVIELAPYIEVYLDALGHFLSKIIIVSNIQQFRIQIFSIMHLQNIQFIH